MLTRSGEGLSAPLKDRGRSDASMQVLSWAKDDQFRTSNNVVENILLIVMKRDFGTMRILIPFKLVTLIRLLGGKADRLSSPAPR